MSNIRVLPQPNSPGETRTSQADAVGEQIVEPIPFPVAEPDPEPIGASLEDIRADLMQQGERLAAVLADPGATFVRDAMRVLAHQVCRIAVIGQVKSRQMTFIGALTEQADLLPSDLSPWTTAVVRLHFGSTAAPENTAAEFQLFEKDDWGQLAAGDSRIRELTTQLVPGFEPQLLQRHVDALRQRAELRLGSNFVDLLGAKHSYETVSKETLARYLSPGSSAAENSDGPGQYADITKAADIWLPSGPFKFPVTIIATPGINDPFMVRDEITRHSLEPAELYVVVLSARQPLSTVELATLRILRGLHRDRILIFIDNVDELRDPAADVRNIVSRVRETLAREFPAVDIPVVAGSSKWAAQALSRNEESSGDIAPALIAYAKLKGALRPVEVKNDGQSGPSEEMPNGQQARILSTCSGFPELRRELTKLLLRSHSAHLIRQIAAYFAELSQVNEAAVREEMVKLAIISEHGAHNRNDRELKDVQSELARIQSVAGELERNLAGFQNLLNEVTAEHRTRIYDRLAEILEEYAKAEGQRLMQAFAEGEARRHWRCHTKPLRQRVEAELYSARSAVEERLAETTYNVFPALRETMLRRSPELDLPEAPAPVLPPSSVRVPIEDSIALDLAAPGSLMGWSRSRTQEEHAAELERMLIDEFMPAIDEVIRLASNELQRATSDMADRATAIAVAVIDALRAQSETHIAQAKQLLDAREARSQDEMSSAERLETLRERLSAAEALSRHLATLNTQCSELVS